MQQKPTPRWTVNGTDFSFYTWIAAQLNLPLDKNLEGTLKRLLKYRKRVKK